MRAEAVENSTVRSERRRIGRQQRHKGESDMEVMLNGSSRRRTERRLGECHGPESSPCISTQYALLSQKMRKMKGRETTGGEEEHKHNKQMFHLARAHKLILLPHNAFFLLSLRTKGPATASGPDDSSEWKVDPSPYKREDWGGDSGNRGFGGWVGVWAIMCLRARSARVLWQRKQGTWEMRETGKVGGFGKLAGLREHRERKKT